MSFAYFGIGFIKQLDQEDQQNVQSVHSLVSNLKSMLNNQQTNLFQKDIYSMYNAKYIHSIQRHSCHSGIQSHLIFQSNIPDDCFCKIECISSVFFTFCVWEFSLVSLGDLTCVTCVYHLFCDLTCVLLFVTCVYHLFCDLTCVSPNSADK